MSIEYSVEPRKIPGRETTPAELRRQIRTIQTETEQMIRQLRQEIEDLKTRVTALES